MEIIHVLLVTNAFVNSFGIELEFEFNIVGLFEVPRLLTSIAQTRMHAPEYRNPIPCKYMC